MFSKSVWVSGVVSGLVGGAIICVALISGCETLQITEGEGSKTIGFVHPGDTGMPPIEGSITIPTQPGEGWPWATILGVGLGAAGLNASKRLPYEMIAKGVVKLFR